MASDMGSTGGSASSSSQPSIPLEREPDVAQKRQALDEVLHSTPFLRAEQQRSFLRYICEMEISGRGAELTEHQIGVEALGRPAGYSTGEDSGVRRHAHDLRQRLDEAYAADLAHVHVRIELPKGGYTPRFTFHRPRVAGAAPPEAPQSARSRRAAFGLGLALGTLLVPAGLALRCSLRTAPPVDPSPAFEAEAQSSLLLGSAVRGECATCSGGGRVKWVGRGGEVVVNEVRVAAPGEYLLQIDYLLDGARSLFVAVNDAPDLELKLRGNSWQVPASTAVLVPLHAGGNRIRLHNDRAHAPDLDRILLR